MLTFRVAILTHHEPENPIERRFDEKHGVLVFHSADQATHVADALELAGKTVERSMRLQYHTGALDFQGHKIRHVREALSNMLSEVDHMMAPMPARATVSIAK